MSRERLRAIADGIRERVIPELIDILPKDPDNLNTRYNVSKLDVYLSRTPIDYSTKMFIKCLLGYALQEKNFSMADEICDTFEINPFHAHWIRDDATNTFAMFDKLYARALNFGFTRDTIPLSPDYIASIPILNYCKFSPHARQSRMLYRMFDDETNIPTTYEKFLSINLRDVCVIDGMWISGHSLEYLSEYIHTEQNYVDNGIIPRFVFDEDAYALAIPAYAYYATGILGLYHTLNNRSYNQPIDKEAYTKYMIYVGIARQNPHFNEIPLSEEDEFYLNHPRVGVRQHIETALPKLYAIPFLMEQYKDNEPALARTISEFLFDTI